jgi:DNA-binding MarR family transcriptional regulator
VSAPELEAEAEAGPEAEAEAEAGPEAEAEAEAGPEAEAEAGPDAGGERGRFDPIHEAARLWSASFGPEPVPAMVAVTSVMRAQQILMGRLNELLRPLDLTFPRYEALMLLRFSRTGSLPLGRIGERLQVHPTSVTNTIDGLERLGLVRREPSLRDRRRTLATLTREGRVRAERASALLNEARFGTAPLGDAELGVLSEVLRALRDDADGSSATR